MQNNQTETETRNTVDASTMLKNNNVNKCDYLIVDTAGFIKNIQLEKYGNHIITLPEVLEEVKDKQSKNNLIANVAMMVENDIVIRQPSDECVARVVAFSKLTGDYKVLSPVDMRVLALTLMVYLEKVGNEGLKTQPYSPPPTVTSNNNNNNNNNNDKDKQDDDTHDDARMNEEEEKEKEDDVKDDQDETEIEKEKDDNKDNNKDDGEGEWITPKNINTHIAKGSKPAVETLQGLKVGCLTTDYAMQNVLLQMGLALISLDGFRIKTAKQWVFRCHACLKLCTDMTKEFCPMCGNHTLIRISKIIDSDTGEVTYSPLPKNFKLRGNIFSLPTPKGGRNNNDVILCEDELQSKQRRFIHSCGSQGSGMKKKSNDNNDITSLEYSFGSSPFTTTTFPKYGIGKRNPNQVRKPPK